MNTRIVSFGKYLPKKIVTNDDLKQYMDTSDEWIQQRSGIKERRWAMGDETSSNMGLWASQDALKKANLQPDDIDAIIYTCLMSDYQFPGGAPQIQHKLGMKRFVPALDIRDQCAGYLYALQVADCWIKTNFAKRVLIVASELQHTTLDITTRGRETAVLFGDAASATIVEGTTDANQGLLDISLYSQGEFAEALGLLKPSPNDHPKLTEHLDIEKFYGVMDGRLVFKNAVTRMVECMTAICEKNSVKIEDVDFVIAHQANQRIIQMVLNQLKIPETKTHYTLDRLGNTTAATIPLTFEEAAEQGKIKRGDLVAMTAFGSGFVWGASLMRY